MNRQPLDDQPFDPPGKDRARAARPKDAATLILVRGGAEVMLGQRAAAQAFMPDKWVFPGGKVDPGDARARAARELASPEERLLRWGGVRRAPRAFALAAARETEEETGLKLGGPEGPDLSALRFVCRAITPPYRPIRYDARFFVAAAEAVLTADAPRGCDELLHVRWFGFDEAERLDLPSITRFVLSEVRARLEGAALAPAFLCWRRGRHSLERLQP